MKRSSRDLIMATAATLAALLLTACIVPGGPGSGSTVRGPSDATSSGPGSSTATESSTQGGDAAGDAVPGAESIPPGRSFAEGGGGPNSYTFREEWRRASQEAQKWRPGAFLVTASGPNVNNDGVPSSWSMRFVNAIPTDEILVVEIDPWGTITRKHTIRTAEITDQLQPGDAQIPFGIMDSDAAVAKGEEALSGGMSSNARLLLSFARDHTGPYWSYVVEGPDSQLATARINALTGATNVLGQ